MGFLDFLGNASTFGAYGMVKGGDDLAAAEQQAGQATADATTKAIAEEESRRTENINLAKEYGTQTWGELSSINTILTDKTTALNASLDSLKKQQAILDQADPVVKSASSNLQDLLAGKQAAMLKPLQAVLDRQQAELKNNLVGQMGPGWASSSAGIEAMTKFFESSAVTMGTAQMNALTQASNIFTNAFGLQQQGQASITQGTLAAYNQAQVANSQVLQANQLDASREGSLVMSAAGTPVDYMAAANAAALPFGGAIQSATNNQQMGAFTFGNTIGLGPTLFGKGSGGFGFNPGGAAAASGGVGAAGASGVGAAGAATAAGGASAGAGIGSMVGEMAPLAAA